MNQRCRLQKEIFYFASSFDYTPLYITKTWFKTYDLISFTGKSLLLFILIPLLRVDSFFFIFSSQRDHGVGSYNVAGKN